MQQVFKKETAAHSQRPFISFPVPKDIGNAAHETVGPERRKRPRPSATADSVTDDTAAALPVITYHLTHEERKALARFIEYGNQPLTAADSFRRLAGHRSGAAASFSSVPEPYEWCCVALRHTLSLLCRVVRLDANSIYLQPTSPSLKVVTEELTAATAPATVANISTLEWYCRCQALELELEDVLLRAHTVTNAEGVPEAIRQQARADVEATVRCVEDCVDTLEATLVAMLLRLENPARKRGEEGGSQEPPPGELKANTGGSNSFLAGAAPSAGYVAAMVRGLPEVFRSEQWPTRFVCSTECGASATPVPLSPACQSTSRLAAALLGQAVAASRSTTSLPSPGVDSLFQAQVGGVTTSLALQGLLLISRADVWNVLGMANASPLGRLAALDKLKNPSSTSAVESPQRPVLDMERMEFKDLLVRAWNHGYALAGLQRLHFEMQALFYHLASQGAAGSSPTCRATRHEVLQLWGQWESVMSDLFKGFLRRVGDADATSETAESDVLDEVESAWGGQDSGLDACARMRRHAVSASALAEVQTAALRVVAKLQTVDTKGWFAVPAFDLVNVDFTSVRYWLMSPSFAHKSKREAFRSLCRVLERMVDSCVQKYGPTHAFSDVITNVRQQLVDIARAEGLL